MGTDHLKARCLCKDYDQGIYPGCPIHAKPTPIDTEKAAEIGKRLADRAIQYAGKFIPTDAQVKQAVAEVFDPVNHPPHYEPMPGIPFDCITVTRDMTFNAGNAVKYMWRADRKNGVEDIKKAQWYINDALEHGDVVHIGQTPGQWNARMTVVARAQTDPDRKAFFLGIANGHLETAAWQLHHLLRKADQ